jgi:hypothetical protein
LRRSGRGSFTRLHKSTLPIPYSKNIFPDNINFCFRQRDFYRCGNGSYVFFACFSMVYPSILSFTKVCCRQGFTALFRCGKLNKVIPLGIFSKNPHFICINPPKTACGAGLLVSPAVFSSTKTVAELSCLDFINSFLSILLNSASPLTARLCGLILPAAFARFG